MSTLPRSVALVTLLVPVNVLVALVGGPYWLLGTLFLLGPLAVLWMVWNVLRDTSATQPELPTEAEWGYQDRADLVPVRCE
jgi:membrane protein implicated in regulation of membrane protease activity